MEIYNKPRQSQPKEKQFREYLLKNLISVQHINETYKLSEKEFLNPFIDVRKIEKYVLADKDLPAKKRELAIGFLNQLPDKIKVAKNCNLVSVDFVIIDSQGNKIYLEFHEKQHRNLSVGRLTPVYDEQSSRIEIPRFVQRLLKDMWRFENLPNYKIVWFDWFEANGDYDVHDLLFSDKAEFGVENRFTFTKLLSTLKGQNPAV